MFPTKLTNMSPLMKKFVRDLNMFFIKSTLIDLQKCTIWPKKSSKGQ